MSDFAVTYERDNGVASGVERVAKHGTALAQRVYDVKVPDCADWKVAVDLLAKSNQNEVAATHPDPPDFTITVYTHGIWFGESASDRLITMLHEWYHVVEFALFRCPSSCPYIPAPPDWLVEGAAVYESYRSADALHLASYSSLRARELYFAKKDHTPLDLMAGNVNNAIEYSVSFLAIEYLVRSRGAGALFDFWNELGKHGYVEGAFRHAFGISLSAFYKRFQAYRSRGFVGA